MDVENWKRIIAELAVLRQAPFATAFSFLLVALLVWAVAQWANERRFALLQQQNELGKQQLELGKQQLEDMRDRLNFTSSPNQPRVQPPVQAFESPPRMLANRDQLLTPVIRNLRFRLVDVLSDEPGGEIRGRVFEDCDIHGPAIIQFGENIIFEGNVLDGTTEALMWEVPFSRKFIVGVVRVSNSTFRRCRLQGIGFAGNPVEIASLVRSTEMGLPPPHLRGGGGYPR